MDEPDDFSLLCNAIRRTPSIALALVLFFGMTVMAFFEMPLAGLAVSALLVLLVKEIINQERKKELKS